MAIKAPVSFNRGWLENADGTPICQFTTSLEHPASREIVQAVNLLPQLIQQLEQASQFIHELAVDEGYDDNPIVAQIDALVAKAKG